MPFILKNRPFIIEVKVIDYVIIEVQVIYNWRRGHVLLKFRPFIIDKQAIFHWSTGHFFLKYRSFII